MKILQWAQKFGMKIALYWCDTETFIHLKLKFGVCACIIPCMSTITLFTHGNHNVSSWNSITWRNLNVSSWKILLMKMINILIWIFIGTFKICICCFNISKIRCLILLVVQLVFLAQLLDFTCSPLATDQAKSVAWFYL